MKKLNITIFTGGSGNKEILNIIKDIPWIDITIITNCYDDGKSTGRLRYLINGMLGPSDIRKNVGNLIKIDNSIGIVLKKIIEFRLKKTSFQKLFQDYASDKNDLKILINNLPKKLYEKINKYIIFFLKKFKNKKKIEYDISLGNLIFAGIFLKFQNFNKSVKEFNEIFLNTQKVFNITDGENLYLTALRENGEIIYEEGDLVEKQGKNIADIFLTKEKFLSNRKEINKLNYENKVKFLKQKCKIPKMNYEIEKKIIKSDLVIYGPGTQNSSLYPSYLTKNLNNILKKTKAKKVFIGNIFYDKDIINENMESIIEKFFFFMCNKKFISKSKKKKFIDYYFLNNYDEQDLNNNQRENYISFAKKKMRNFKFLDWEKNKGKHYPGLLLKELIKITKKKNFINKINIKSYTLSIIVPALNEQKNIRKVLNDLSKLNFDDLNLTKEIIVVDGGSNDKTHSIVKNFKYCKFFKTYGGKGDVLRYGLKKTKGDIIAFYPSDNEYDVKDLKKIVRLIYSKESNVIFGNRNIKMLNMSSQIKKIYNNKIIGYLISKYGGMLLSILCLFFFNRYIGDSLTSIKVFNKTLIKSLPLKSSGFDIELEITSKILNKKELILEIPVNYKPRSKMDGKKITFIDGIKCILTIFKHGFLKTT